MPSTEVSGGTVSVPFAATSHFVLSFDGYASKIVLLVRVRKHYLGN